MPPEQQDTLVYDILKFTMPDGSSISPAVRADVILRQFGLPEDVPQLRRLVAMGIARHDQRTKRRGQTHA